MKCKNQLPFYLGCLLVETCCNCNCQQLVFHNRVRRARFNVLGLLERSSQIPKLIFNYTVIHLPLLE